MAFHSAPVASTSSSFSMLEFFHTVEKLKVRHVPLPSRLAT